MAGYIADVIQAKPGDPDAAAAEIRKIQGYIVVNISAVGIDPCLLSQENLEQVSAAGNGTIFLEQLRQEDYRNIIRDRLTNLIDLVRQMEKKLCSVYITAILEELAALLTQLDGAAGILTPVTVQKQALEPEIERMKQAKEAIAMSGFYYEDNVRCRDNLCYVLLPQLQAAISYIDNSF